MCRLDIWFKNQSKMIKSNKFRSRGVKSIFSFDDNYIYFALPNQIVQINFLL